MEKFLLTVALGEYIAFKNAQYISNWYRQKESLENEKKYLKIAEEEKDHFTQVSGLISQKKTLNKDTKSLFKGDYLTFPKDKTPESSFERMCVMHIVFESAAFAYMSELSKDKNRKIAATAKSVLKDESEHIHIGFANIAREIRNFPNPVINAVKESCRRHAKEVNKIPHRTLTSDTMANKLCEKFKLNVNSNFRRIFNEQNLLL